jgi:hypothetical protein
MIVKVDCPLRKAHALGSRDNWWIEFRLLGSDSKLPFEAQKDGASLAPGCRFLEADACVDTKRVL